MQKKCLNCGRTLPNWMRSDAKYCSDHCRYVVHGKRRHLPRWAERLRDLLVIQSPIDAIAYRLALIRGREVWWYPPRNRASVRVVGPPRQSAYFALVPEFEAPIVPTTDLYGVVFYDARGRLLRTPASLLAGVEAKRLRRIRVEDGEQD